MAAQGRRDGHGGRPEERVGCGPKKDCTWGLGQPGGGRGLPETCVLVTECGVYHLFLLSWPSACTPPPSSGRARPKGWSTGLHGGQALPCGTWDLRGGWQAGPRGRISWQHRPLHAACRGPWPAPRGVASPSPPCTATQSQWLFLAGSGTCGKGPGTPSPATWARADALGLPDAKDLGGAGRGHCALHLPSRGPWPRAGKPAFPRIAGPWEGG